MFKINSKTLYNEEVEMYKVSTFKNGEALEDTYDIFIGAKDSEDTFVLDIYTVVPRKTFYKLDFKKKTLINEYLDSHDVSVSLNSHHSIEKVDNGFFTLTRIGKTLFKFDMVLPKLVSNDVIEYVEIHTHIDMFKDVYTNK